MNQLRLKAIRRQVPLVGVSGIWPSPPSVDLTGRTAVFVVLVAESPAGPGSSGGRHGRRVHGRRQEKTYRGWCHRGKTASFLEELTPGVILGACFGFHLVFRHAFILSVRILSLEGDAAIGNVSFSLTFQARGGIGCARTRYS